MHTWLILSFIFLLLTNVSRRVVSLRGLCLLGLKKDFGDV